MKRDLLMKIGIVALLTGIVAVGLTQISDDDDKKKKVEKKVEIIQKDGETTVRVETTENGETTIEEYTGEEAEEYLDKMHTSRMMSKAGGQAKVMKFKLDGDSTDFDFDFDFSFDTDEFEEEMKKHMQSFDIEIEKLDSAMAHGQVMIKIMTDSMETDLTKEMEKMMKEIEIRIMKDTSTVIVR